MTLHDFLWARGEFYKLGEKMQPLFLMASDKELGELGHPIPQVGVPFFGMELVKIPKGWYIQDGKGNQIGK